VAVSEKIEGDEAAADSGRGVGSLARGLRILEAVVEASAPMSLANIAQVCGFDTSTAHRLLQVLVKEGYILKDDTAKKYLASPRGFFPLSLYHPLNVIRRDAEYAMMSLRDEVADTVGLIFFCFGQRLLIDLVHGGDSLSPYYDTWVTSPLHGSASGKVLLTSLTDEERRARLGPGPYEPQTSHTIADPALLQADLEASLERGYVVARDDAFVGLTALGAPITQNGDAIGCFFVFGRSTNFDDAKTERTGQALSRAAELFSHGTPSLKAVSDLLGPRPAAIGS
jgi:IclR family transcriptional regulator, acetate operon repressor